MPADPITVVSFLSNALTILKSGIELISKHDRKFSFKIDQFKFDEHYYALIGLASITNLNNNSYTIESINLTLNDTIEIEHSFITKIEQASKFEYLFYHHHNELIINNLDFHCMKLMDYQPYLAKNQNAYGIIVFHLNNYRNILPKSLKVTIALAGYSDQFSFRLK